MNPTDANAPQQLSGETARGVWSAILAAGVAFTVHDHPEIRTTAGAG